MKVVGLTGGIGSGKTTVANYFRDLGVPVYISDIEAKRLMDSSEEIVGKITDLFGSQAYSDGRLNRKYLASQVFGNKEKLAALNAIVHPAVRSDFVNWKKEQPGAYVVYEAAILFETGGNTSCDFTILVTAEKSARISRLQQRDSSTLEEIEARMDNQWSDERKKEIADFIIENDNLSETLQKVLEIHQILLQVT